MVQHPQIFLVPTILTFVTILAVFAMKYFSAARVAHAGVANADSMTALRNDLSDVKTKLAAIEKVLREVE